MLQHTQFDRKNRRLAPRTVCVTIRKTHCKAQFLFNLSFPRRRNVIKLSWNKFQKSLANMRLNEGDVEWVTCYPSFKFGMLGALSRTQPTTLDPLTITQMIPHDS